MWQQDTTVVDSAPQEALVDTIFVAVGGGVATAATVFAAVVGAVAAIVIAAFTWVTHRRDTKDREERILAIDTKVSVRAHLIKVNLDGWTAAFPSGDDAFDWAMQFRKSIDLQKKVRRLAEISSGASVPVSKAVAAAYVSFLAAAEKLTLAARESEPGNRTNLCRHAHIFLQKCAIHLSDAIDEELKSAAAGLILTP